jgi:DNA-binding MarR family transcriptional regulator
VGLGDVGQPLDELITRPRVKIERSRIVCDDHVMSQDASDLLGYQLGRVLVALRAEITAALLPLDLSFPQFVCMRVLHRNPGQSNAELSRSTNVSPQSMHAVMQSLEDASILERPKNVDFGRARPARLTRRGTALLTRAEAAVRTAEGHFLDPLSPRRQNEFRRCLALLGGGAPPSSSRSKSAVSG